MIGAGAVGAGCAWRLAREGFEVTLIDPGLRIPPSRQPESGGPASTRKGLHGTMASLGILMGLVFRRSSGRAWRLRQRSMELWPEWAEELNRPESPLQLETSLVQMAASAEEGQRQQQLAEERADLGLRFLSPQTLKRQHPHWPGADHGALQSERDGRIDPLALLGALRHTLQQRGVRQIAASVTAIQRPIAGRIQPWQLQLDTGERLQVEQLLICAALASQTLLRQLNHDLPMEPVLGQVLDLQLPDGIRPGADWPAVLVCQGFNLVPHSHNRLWLGATLEPGAGADPARLNAMQTLQGQAPDWLQAAAVIQCWQGLRARPQNRPAPLLEVLEPGLMVATGHYRNGVLLAPATAEWACTQAKRL